MKSSLLQCILHYTIQKYLNVLFLLHEATSTSIYPTIYFIKTFDPSIPGHEATSSSIYPKLHFIKIFYPSIPEA